MMRKFPIREASLGNRIESTGHLAFWGIALLAAILVALPFWGIETLPLSDYPNHMARFHIKENLATSSVLQDLYVKKDTPYVYWGMEGIMSALTPLLGAEKASYAFSIFALYLPLFGCLALSRVVTGHANLITLGGILFVFSEVAGWGFTNYLLTSGLALIVFATWIGTDKRDWRLRLPIMLLLATLLTYLHMVSAAVIGLCIGTWELMRILEQRRLDRLAIGRMSLLGLSFLPGAILVVMEIMASVGGSGFRWLSLDYHLRTAFGPFLFISGGRGALWHIVPFVLLYALVKYFNARGVQIVEVDKRLLAVACVVYILGVISPYSISGVSYIGMRFPVLAAFIAMASVKQTNAFLRKGPVFLFCMAVFIKLGLVHGQLKYTDEKLGEMRQAAHMLPEGAKVILFKSGETDSTSLDPRIIPEHRYSNFSTYLILERNALIPNLFTMFDIGIHPDYAQQTIERRYDLPDIAALPDGPLQAYADNWRENYDYVLLMDFNDSPLAELPGTTVVHEGSWFSYHRIDKS